MRLKIKKRDGKWKVYLVYYHGTDGEFEVWFNTYWSLTEAFRAAQMFRAHY